MHSFVWLYSFNFAPWAILIRHRKSEWQEHHLGALLGCIESRPYLSVRFVGVNSLLLFSAQILAWKWETRSVNFLCNQQCAEMLLYSLRLKRPDLNRPRFCFVAGFVIMSKARCRLWLRWIFVLSDKYICYVFHGQTSRFVQRHVRAQTRLEVTLYMRWFSVFTREKRRRNERMEGGVFISSSNRRLLCFCA